MHGISRRSLLKTTLALSTLFAAPSVSTAQDHEMKKPAMAKKTRLGLDGYCPVCITEMKQWMKGSEKFKTTYDGITYYFPGEGPMKKFLAAPEKYVPALGGDCIACWAMAKKRVPGKVGHSALHKGRLYLFPSDKEQQAFVKNAAKLAKADLAYAGHCSVCAVMANKKVAGKPQFTAMHNGFRYLFPSDRERQMFLKEPAKFADKSLAPMKKQMEKKTTAMLTITGKTSCAACSHGVKPIGAPDQLGLAVTDADGTVFIIEEAHSRWPSLYKSRFDGKSVRVAGKVVKRDGKFTWVSPSELTVL